MNPYIAQFTVAFIQMLTWAIIARSFLSFLPIDQSSNLYQIIYRVTEPIIEPIRRVIPQTGMIDFSPMAAILLLIVMTQVVVNLSAPA